MSSAALETPKYSKGHHEDEHEHDEHEQVTAGNEHSEFRAHYLFDCSAIPETKIPIMAFTHCALDYGNSARTGGTHCD